MSSHSNIKEFLGLEETQGFNTVGIAVASPDAIRSWSRGEVKNAETINYRSLKPEPYGLFCQRTFGPVRCYECACGKYKRIKHQNVVCDRCGVEVTVSSVRRERMGHIELAVPIAHIWFWKNTPSCLGSLLDMTARHLERVIYYENYMVTDQGNTPLELHQLLTEQEYLQAQEEYGHDAFVAKMGAEAIKDALAKLDLKLLVQELGEQMHSTRSKQIKKKLARRLKVVSGFVDGNMRPDWLILDALPVIPPDLRPLIAIDGGRFASSDINDLYRRVINRNNRLKNLFQINTPDVIIHNEKRMLQEAVDALFDNGRHGRPVMGPNNRPLRSLSDTLKGKQGRFRQNLLGKRVDYSARSVIVIGPELKLHQCGLPKKMALVLFEPFIIRRLKELGFAHTVRGARKMIERRAPEVWDILDEVTRNYPVLLNRAPTLHRLSIQAFETTLIEGDAIRIHPLVCGPYNADFDGDQMAVHVPLSIEAVMEAKLLMLASHNIFSPSSGKPVLTPSQDIVLGAYYLTLDPPTKPAKNERVPLVPSAAEALTAQSLGKLRFHSWVDFVNPDFGHDTVYGNKERKVIRTTVGRILFSTIWPRQLGFLNFPVVKSKLGDLILNTYRCEGKAQTAITLDKLKELGFKIATKAGISIGVCDMIIPPEKTAIISESYKKIDEVESQYRKGIITPGELSNKRIDIWTGATDQIAKAVMHALETNGGDTSRVNPVFIMSKSGARGNNQQIRQLCGIRGLIATPSGSIIEKPILNSLRDGLTELDYFNSTHGARKGLADTALKTADAGYLTRKLCDATMNTTIGAVDDGCRDGIWKSAIYDGDQEIATLAERIAGRCACEDLFDPTQPAVCLVKAGQLITDELAAKIESLGIERVKVMSPLANPAHGVITAKAYGTDLSKNCADKLVEPGTAVGIIAAQSIGEPGTQLTMRTFHIGGVASQVFKVPEIRVRSSGRVRYRGLRIIRTAEGANIVLNKTGSVVILDDEDKELESYNIVAGAVLRFADGQSIAKDEALAMWDPHNIPILSEKEGRVVFKDMIPGITIKRQLEESTGRVATVVIEHKEDLNPTVQVCALDGKQVLATAAIPVGAQLVVNEGDVIAAGSLLAKTPRSAATTQDITGGLLRVVELFEARRPAEAAQMARIEGIVSLEGTVRGKRRVVVTHTETGQHEEHLIPHGKHIIVHAGDHVHKGQPLTEGAADPHEILEILGVSALIDFLIREVQIVYRSQGVAINDKHFEVVFAQMLRKVRVTEPGDTEFLWGSQVDRAEFAQENQRVSDAGGQPAKAEPVLLGITKAALDVDKSFIAAASFQETPRVLTEAAVACKKDPLVGFKENITVGNPVPAGTGFRRYRTLKVRPLVSEWEKAAVVQEDLLEPQESLF